MLICSSRFFVGETTSKAEVDLSYTRNETKYMNTVKNSQSTGSFHVELFNYKIPWLQIAGGKLKEIFLGS